MRGGHPGFSESPPKEVADVGAELDRQVEEEFTPLREALQEYDEMRDDLVNFMSLAKDKLGITQDEVLSRMENKDLDIFTQDPVGELGKSDLTTPERIAEFTDRVRNTLDVMDSALDAIASLVSEKQGGDSWMTEEEKAFFKKGENMSPEEPQSETEPSARTSMAAEDIARIVGAQSRRMAYLRRAVDRLGLPR